MDEAFERVGRRSRALAAALAILFALGAAGLFGSGYPAVLPPVVADAGQPPPGAQVEEDEDEVEEEKEEELEDEEREEEDREEEEEEELEEEEESDDG